MRNTSLTLFSIVLISIVSCTKLEPGQVKIAEGIVQGSVEGDLTVFKGIPFAAPPIGDL